MLMGFLSVKAQTPELVQDINTLPQQTIPLSHVMDKAGDKVFFTSVHANVGIYDGTDYTTIDVTTGTFAARDFIDLNGTVYFTADDGTNGRELWKYDGTTATLIDINSSGDSNPSYLTVWGSDLYFAADDGVDGNELWKYDGTTATQVHDIQEGSVGSDPEYLVVYNDELVFFADDGVNGQEFWKYDGTSTSLVQDIRGGSIGSAATSPDFEEYDGKLYFNASTGSQSLWVYDGTDVTNVDNTIGNPRLMTQFNSKLYFYGFVSGSDFGGELWEYDGTTVTNVGDINEGSGNSNIANGVSGGSHFAIVNGNMYFEADDGVNGDELYKFDGTSVTRIDLNPGSGNGNPDFLSVINSKLYFQGYDGTITTLREYDGTNLNTIDMGEGQRSPRHMTELNGKVVFTTVFNDNSRRWELYEYDGTTASRVPTHGKTESGDPYYITALGDKIYFTADDGINGRELWSSDGTTTELVADQYPGIDATEGYNMVSFGDKLLYFGYTAEDDVIYVYDGSSFEVFNYSGSEGDGFFEYNGALYFQGCSDEFGCELYTYNGSTITLVEDINEGTNSSYPGEFCIYNNDLYFKARDATSGNELWKYDGATVSLVADINSGTGHSSPSELTVAGSNLYFRATSSTQGQELGMYDGTSVSIIDIFEGSSSSSPGNLTEYQNKLVLKANDGVNGHDLHIVDGTNVQLIDVNPSGDSYPNGFFEFKDILYFEAFDGVNGSELFKYDGTDLTPFDLVTGAEASNPSSFFEFGPYMYFGAQSDGNPYGLHRYDGMGDIEFVAEVEPYVQNGDDYYTLGILDNYAYFMGYNGVDDELYRIRRIEIENDILTFSLAEQTGNAVIDAENHTITIETLFGTDVSNLNPTISISDYAELDLSGAQDFSSPVVYTVTSEYGEAQEWTVTVTTAPNAAPIVENELSDVQDNAGFGSTVISYANVFSDAEGHSLNISVESSDENVVTAEVIEGDQIQINEVGVGSSTITITADDGFGGSVSDAFSFSVNNNAPTVANPIIDENVDQGFETTSINLAEVFADPDGDELTFTATSNNTDVATVAVTEATLTISEVGIGTTTISISTSDGNGGSVADEFTFTVSEVALGLEDLKIKIYPNPTSNFIHIDAKESISARLMDMEGRELKREVGTQLQMNLQSLQPGIYLLKIMDGDRSANHRIIKAN